MTRVRLAGPLMLLSAWLLVQAPRSEGPGGSPVDHTRATIKWWSQVHAYDSARDCEDSRIKEADLKEQSTRCVPAYVLYP